MLCPNEIREIGTCSIPIKEELVTWRWLKAVCLLVGNDHLIESILFLTKASMAWKALGGACQKVSTAPTRKEHCGHRIVFCSVSAYSST